jgi:hypothetical protein
MKKITIIAIAAAVLSAHPARAETATSRAIVACENLSKLDERNTCLGRIPNCKVVLTRDFDDTTQNVHWHNGKEFDIDGGSEDPGQLCQHVGSCIPISAVRFKTACVLVPQKSISPPYSPYYHWEVMQVTPRHAAGAFFHRRRKLR